MKRSPRAPPQPCINPESGVFRVLTELHPFGGEPDCEGLFSAPSLQLPSDGHHRTFTNCPDTGSETLE
ncbi:Hypothetical predicted protein, partial [Marmota monax]